MCPPLKIRGMSLFNTWRRITPVTHKGRRIWVKALRGQWIKSEKAWTSSLFYSRKLLHDLWVNFTFSFLWLFPSSLFFYFLFRQSAKEKAHAHYRQFQCKCWYTDINKEANIHLEASCRILSAWPTAIYDQWMALLDEESQCACPNITWISKTPAKECPEMHICSCALHDLVCFWSALLLAKSWSCFLMMGTLFFPLSMHRKLAHLQVLCVGNSDCWYISSFTNVIKYQVILLPKSNLTFLLRFLLIQDSNFSCFTSLRKKMRWSNRNERPQCVWKYFGVNWLAN